MFNQRSVAAASVEVEDPADLAPFAVEVAGIGVVDV